MCYVQSSWEVAQSSYDVCHVSAQSSWKVVQSSYDVYHLKVFVFLSCFLILSFVNKQGYFCLTKELENNLFFNISENMQ